MNPVKKQNENDPLTHQNPTPSHEKKSLLSEVVELVDEGWLVSTSERMLGYTNRVQCCRGDD